MHQIQDILIPSRFLIFILQILLSISACISREDNILAGLDANITIGSTEYNKAQTAFLVGISLFYIFETIELGILLSGMTLFNNRLSIALCVLLFLWYNYEQWESTSIWTEWAIGGIVPLILELFGLFTVTFTHRKVTKIK